MELDLIEKPPFAVRARFELAAGRIADSWLGTRRVEVSAEDFRIARDFLERDGWVVEELAGVRVRLTYRYFRSAEVSREVAVLVAFRRLAAPTQARARAALGQERPLSPPALVQLSAAPRSAGAACPAESPASPF